MLNIKRSCEYELCEEPDEDVIYYHRSQILEIIDMGRVSDDWYGYSFHESCFKKWLRSWRK